VAGRLVECHKERGSRKDTRLQYGERLVGRIVDYYRGGVKGRIVDYHTERGSGEDGRLP
jgi:hypothetical protein